MIWLRGLGISLKVAVIAFLAVLAVMAAKRQRASAGKWRDKAVDMQRRNVKDGTETAVAASTQAMFHDEKARQIKQKAVDRVAQMGGQDEDVSSILDQFRNSS